MADDNEGDGLYCAGCAGIFSACRNTNRLNEMGGWLGGLFNAYRDANGTNTTSEGNHGSLSPSPILSLAPAPDENLGSGLWSRLWGGQGGDKSGQEGDLTVEDLTATFEDEGEADSNTSHKVAGTSTHSKIRVCV